MGTLTITTHGSFDPPQAIETSALKYGHACAVQRAIELLQSEVLPKAIEQDKKLLLQSAVPKNGWGLFQQLLKDRPREGHSEDCEWWQDRHSGKHESFDHPRPCDCGVIDELVADCIRETDKKIFEAAQITLEAEATELRCNECGKVLPPLESGEGEPCVGGYLCRECLLGAEEEKE